MQKPKEDPCTCTERRLADELGAIRNEVTKASNAYCKENKLRCHGEVSNTAFGDLVGNLTIGTLTGYNGYRGLASIAGVSTPNTEDALGFGVRCQQVYDGVVGRVIQSLRDQGRTFACTRIAEAVVINHGKTFSNTLNGNHVIPALVPFHFRPFAATSMNIGYRPKFQGNLPSAVSTMSTGTPASPEQSALLKGVILNLFDPWKDGASNSDAPPKPASYTDSKDLLYLTPMEMGGACETPLAAQRDFDKTQGRTFDPFCHAPKVGAPNAASLDKEYYCNTATGTTSPNAIVCPEDNDDQPPPDEDPDPTPAHDPSECSDDALPSCSDPARRSEWAAVEEAQANAQCFEGQRGGGADYCIAPLLYDGGFNEYYFRPAPLDFRNPDPQAYYTWFPNSCRDVSGNLVNYATVGVHLPSGDCPPPPPPPDPGPAPLPCSEGGYCGME